MAKMIQVRNVPDRLHRELKRRAKMRGQPLTEYIEEILEREVSLPPQEEVFERIRQSEPVDLAPGQIAEWIRVGRAERERRWDDSL
jgi:plasmid stability protein